MKIILIDPPPEMKVTYISGLYSGTLFKFPGRDNLYVMSGYNDTKKSYDYYDLTNCLDHSTCNRRLEVIVCDGELKYWEVKP